MRKSKGRKMYVADTMTDGMRKFRELTAENRVWMDLECWSIL